MSSSNIAGGSSPKNVLQERLARDPSMKEWFARYSSYDTDTSEGKMWTSICTLVSSDGNMRFEGVPQSRKVDSDASAATIALEYLNRESREASAAVHLSIKRRSIVLVDLENVPRALRDVTRYFGGDVAVTSPVMFLFFYSPNSAFPKHEKIPNYRFVKVPSTRKDAADVGICFYLGYHLSTLLATMPDMIPDYHIISKDHFAETLKECVSQYGSIAHPLLQHNVKCYVHDSVDSFLVQVRE